MFEKFKFSFMYMIISYGLTSSSLSVQVVETSSSGSQKSLAEPAKTVGESSENEIAKFPMATGARVTGPLIVASPTNFATELAATAPVPLIAAAPTNFATELALTIVEQLTTQSSIIVDAGYSAVPSLVTAPVIENVTAPTSTRREDTACAAVSEKATEPLNGAVFQLVWSDAQLLPSIAHVAI
jgi:hypothetical protein